MKFCKKCHRRIVEKFNSPFHCVQEAIKVCRCNINWVGIGESPKLAVQWTMGSKFANKRAVLTQVD